MALLVELAVKYGVKILVVLTLILSLTAGYYYWKHSVERGARAEERNQCTAERNKFHDDADAFKKARSEEVEKINQSADERVRNAEKLANELRTADSRAPIPARVYIRTNPRDSCDGGVPEDIGNKAGSASGNGGSNQAELPAGNIRKLDEILRSVRQLQINCGEILSDVP